LATWTIGEITATRIEESVGPTSVGPRQFLTNFDAEVFQSHFEWMVPNHYDPVEDRLVTSIHSWLIRTPRHIILLDTCSGNHKIRPWSKRMSNLDTPYLERLADAGVRPENVDIVLCTHLHTDHCGWNTQRKDGRWAPTFPNAKYLFSRKENDRWSIDNERAALYQDSVLPVIESKQAVLLDDAPHQIDDTLLVEPAPGHTPGHILLKAGKDENQGVFCGDAIHHPVQVYEPSWNTKFCEDPAQAQLTRRSMLEFCAEETAPLFPIHFAKPYVTAILRRGDRFLPAFMPADR
jgi:glyoxylase-like metal-dependent hydrolase (beta-lactamase superfamily II)